MRPCISPNVRFYGRARGTRSRSRTPLVRGRAGRPGGCTVRALHHYDEIDLLTAQLAALDAQAERIAAARRQVAGVLGHMDSAHPHAPERFLTVLEHMRPLPATAGALTRSSGGWWRGPACSVPPMSTRCAPSGCGWPSTCAPAASAARRSTTRPFIGDAGPHPAHSLDALLATAQVPQYLLDLRALPAAGAVADRFDAVTSTMNGPQAQPVDPRVAFDAVIHSDASSPWHTDIGTPG